MGVNGANREVGIRDEICVRKKKMGPVPVCVEGHTKPQSKTER